MLQWFRRRQLAERLAQADAEALVRDQGAEAYGEARRRERDVGHCQTNFGSSLAVVASGHEQPLPLFQQLA